MVEIPSFQSSPSEPAKPPKTSPFSVNRLVLLGAIVAPVSFFLYYWRTLTASLNDKAESAWLSQHKPGATAEAYERVVNREAERLNSKLRVIRDGLAQARARRVPERDMRAIEYSLDKVEQLIQMRYFKEAEQKLEKIKRLLPPVPEPTNLESPPKPIDVPAPPKEVFPDIQETGPAPAEPVKKAKKPVRKKPARRR